MDADILRVEALCDQSAAHMRDTIATHLADVERLAETGIPISAHDAMLVRAIVSHVLGDWYLNDARKAG